jgi:hypothetical protein
MAIILYGGTKETVLKQLACEKHDWHGPGIDRVSRYFKCTKCFCIQRDFLNEKDYFKAASDLEKKED